MEDDEIPQGPFGPYDYWDAAKYTAEFESPAEGFNKLFERFEALYEMAYPLMWVRERDLTQPLTVSPSGVQQLGEVLTAIGHLHCHYARHYESLRDANCAPPGWDVMNHSQHEWRERQALLFWRASEELLHHPDLADKRERYEQAIAVGLEYLQRFTTFDELLAHSFDDRAQYGAVMPEYPPAGTVEAWVQAARRSVPEGMRLVPATIEDASFWRRARQIRPGLTDLREDESN